MILMMIMTSGTETLRNVSYTIISDKTFHSLKVSQKPKFVSFSEKLPQKWCSAKFNQGFLKGD